MLEFCSLWLKVREENEGAVLAIGMLQLKYSSDRNIRKINGDFISFVY